MKRCIAIAFAMLCATSVFAAPDSTRIISELQSQYSWIPNDETPRLLIYEPTESIQISYEASGLQLQTDFNGILRGVSFDKGVPDGVNEETLWNMASDVPRKNMPQIAQNYFELLRADGVWDSRVRFFFIRDRDGLLKGFGSINHPITEPIPHVNLSEDEARKVCNKAAANFVYKDSSGNLVHWPVFYEVDQANCRPTVYHYDAVELNHTCEYAPYIAYDFRYRLADKKNIIFDDDHTEETWSYPILNIRINATTGDLVYDQPDFYNLASSKPAVVAPKTTKPVTKLPAVDVVLNAKDAKLGFPLVVVKNTAYVAIPTLQSLAKGHAVAAKAGAKTFSLDGKQLALDAKILDRKGVLYLPWQALNNLPGVKAQFDAKLAKLSITTAAAQNAAAK